MIRTLTAFALMFSGPAMAQDAAGRFDYYVLSLSWSPNWCALEGDARLSPQCDEGTGLGWVLHGLWPQFEDGWPQDCRSRYPEPTRRMTAGMADIMGTPGLAWYQWNKHGACSGLPPTDYFALARQAYAAVTLPDVFMQLDNPVTLPALLVQEAFLRDNPALDPDGVTITCQSGRIQEVRICLTRDLDMRPCGADVVRDCDLDDALFDPVR